MKVRVTFQKGKMTNIEVLEHNDVPFGADAIPRYISSMLNSQTANVDAISNATMTARALHEAVQQCIEQANQ